MNEHTHAALSTSAHTHALCALIGHTWIEHAPADGGLSWFSCDRCGESTPGACAEAARGECPVYSHSWDEHTARAQCAQAEHEPPPPPHTAQDSERIAHAAGSIALAADMGLALALFVCGLWALAIAWCALVALGWIAHAAHLRKRSTAGA